MTGYEGASQSFSTPKDSGHLHGAKWSKIPGSGSTTTTITIRAYGMNGGGWPNMELWVNGVRQQTWTVGSSTPSDYAVNVVLTGNDQIDVTFTNDAVVNGADRNLFVDYVKVGATTIQAENSMVIDRGDGNAMFDGNDALVGGEWLFWSSALRFVVATDPAAALVGYDLNGNVSYKLNNNQATHFTFNTENRLTDIRRNGAVLESYLYDVDGQRVRKSSGGNTTYYPNQYYEQYSGNNVDKYYYFNGQPILLSRNGWPVYLHNDYLNTMAIVTNNTTRVDDQGFYAYGRVRRGGIGIERSYTGQQRDFNSGLIYMDARYYDPEIGQFLSPDTLVPDPVNLFDYNRYMYVRGNPMRYNDPTGRSSCSAIAPVHPIFAVARLGCQVGEMAMQYGPTAVQLAVQWADKLPAVDWLFSSAEQGGHSAGQQNAGNSSTGNFDPNDFDPNKNSNLVKDLGKLINRYPLNSGQCSTCATKTFDLLTKAGYKAEIVKFEYGKNVAARVMLTANGEVIATTRGATLAYHEFVRVGDRVFDAMTGPQGKLWQEYLKLWDPETLRLVTQTIVKSSK